MQQLQLRVGREQVLRRRARVGERHRDGVDHGRHHGRVRRAHERTVDAGEERFVRVLVLHRPPNVDAQDVLGAFPDGVALRVAQLAGHGPVLHVPVAPEDLECLARGPDGLACRADLRERYEDAAHAPAFVLVGRGAARGRAFEGQRRAGLELDEQVDQRLADERVAVDALTPLLASGCVDRGFEEGPPVDAEAHHRDAEPAAVDHLHHPGQAAARTATRTSIGGLAVCAVAHRPSTRGHR